MNNSEKRRISGYHRNKIKCKICGRLYSRSNVTAHKKIQYHKLHAKMIDVLKLSILNYKDERRKLSDIVKRKYKDAENNIYHLNEHELDFYNNLTDNALKEI